MPIENTYKLSLTTQGPTYPPSEVMDQNGDFIVIGLLNERDHSGGLTQRWGRALVSKDSGVPEFGKQLPYSVIRILPEVLSESDQNMVLYTLPLPLPCNNYPMIFAPTECQNSLYLHQESYAFHKTPIPDCRAIDGRKIKAAITLGEWCKAEGNLKVTCMSRSAQFDLAMSGLIPDSVYTVMVLREKDLNPKYKTRPGPLGVPNVFVSDSVGRGHYSASLPDPFSTAPTEERNRVVNVIVLWMSYQMNRGGAIGWFGLGGDIHAQLKLDKLSFYDLNTDI